MGLKATLVKPFAWMISRTIAKWSKNPVAAQEKVFRQLLIQVEKTEFGSAHQLVSSLTYDQFKQQVPVRDYEGLKRWIEEIKAGKANVLWPGKPRYFAKTSGTTSGVKYIPLTRESLPNHFGTARNALFNYFAITGNGHFLDGKMIFLSGSPELENVGGIPTGRLSGIVNHLVPAWLRRSQLPSYQTNCIEDWESKLERIVDETLKQDMRLISGIPPWVQMYYERLLARSGAASVRSLFPGFSIFVYGGVNFEPYRPALEQLVGTSIDTLETYPASEGFIAFQDAWPSKGLLLNVASGIFFEFIPLDEFFSDKPSRLWLAQVKIGVNYVLIINSNAGLWGYNIGDTVEFVSLNPPRIRVTGRVKHFISAFGEHVIGKEVERAMAHASEGQHLSIVEFTVAPQVNPPDGELPYHEWFIEFEVPPVDLEAFAQALDDEMIRQNIYYLDLRKGNILKQLQVRPLKKGAFREYMRSQGKLGGQNKVPRLSNTRDIADYLAAYRRS